jgi:hypothetical protein
MLYVGGIFLPGGGYGTDGKAVLRQKNLLQRFRRPETHHHVPPQA